MITRSKNSDQTAVMAVPEAVDATSLCECVLDDLSGSEVNNGQIFGVDEKLSSPPLISPPLKRKRSTKSWIKPSSTSTLKSTIEIGLPENYVSTKKVFKQAVLSNCIKKDQLEKDSDENCILGTTPCWESFVVKPNIPENASLTVENLALKKAAENNSLDEREKNNAVELSVEENNEEMDRHFKRRMSRPIEQNAQEISCEIKSPKMSVENILLEMTVDDDSVWNDSLEIEEQKIEHQGTAPDEVTKLAVDSDTGSEHNLNDVSTSKSSEKFNGSIDHAVEVKCEGSTDSELNNHVTSDKFQSLQNKSENIHSIHEGDVKKEGLENCIQSDEIYSSEKKSSENSNFICEENVIKEEICNRELRVELRRLKVEEIAKYCQGGRVTKNREASKRESLKIFSCQVCGRTFKRKFNFDKHTNPICASLKSTCKICLMQVGVKECLRTHMKNFHGQRGYKGCVCEFCGKLLRDKYRLKIHIESVHSRKKTYGCDKCLKMFTTRVNLIRHLKSHSDLKLVTCGVCEKKFRTLELLRRHLVVHGITTPSTNFVCVKCEKVFCSKYGLNIHLQGHYNKPFFCLECKRGFKTKTRLNQHLEYQHFNNEDNEKVL